MLVDITPHTLAAGVVFDVYGYYENDDDLDAGAVIERDTVVPVERTKTYYTRVDNQHTVDFPIVQGEGATVGDNTRLGKVRVEGLPPSPQGSPVDVTFRLDLSGILHVSATHMPSGKSAEVTIADSPYRLTRVEAKASGREGRSDADARAGGARGAWNNFPKGTMTLAGAMLARADKALAKADDSEEKTAAQQAREALSEAIEARSADLEERIDALSDALLDLM